MFILVFASVSLGASSSARTGACQIAHLVSSHLDGLVMMVAIMLVSAHDGAL